MNWILNDHPKRLIVATLVCLGSLAAVSSPTLGQTTTAGGSKKISLHERLEKGLQVRRPSEYRYIDAVVDTVERGELPEKIVNRMFFWARSRSPRSAEGHRPIVYFQPGLSRVAAKMRIDIEANPDSTGAAG